MDNKILEAAKQWTLVQPVVSAYVGAVVRDFAARDDVLQEIAVAVLESFERYDRTKPHLCPMTFSRIRPTMLQTGISKLSNRSLRNYLVNPRTSWKLAMGSLVLGCMSIAFAQPPAAPGKTTSGIRKPQMSDTVRANMYADNWFMLYINGELVAVDSIAFVPHNVISVDLLPTYPMTIAVMAKDNADPKTGMEYANTNIGDAGFILKFGDGTVTNAKWKAKAFSSGPIDHDTKNPKVRSEPIPADWYSVGFDDSSWANAKEYTNEQVGPKPVFNDYDFQGARFIWSDDIELDNIVIFRHVVAAPPDGKSRIDFSNLNNVVPDEPKRPPRGGKR